MIARTLIVVVAALLPGVADAQHVHTPEAPQAANAAQCAHVQPAIENIIAAAMTRLEGARQSNDSVQLRAAVDHLGAALRDIRTQLAPCASPAATDPHAGHAIPKTDLSAVTSTKAEPATIAAPKPSAPADPHAGHPRPGAKTSAPPLAKTATTKPPAKPADPHAGHGEPTGQKTELDPVNGLMVDPAAAPKTTFQGRTYYFSSEASLKQFLENPAKFAKPPKK